MRDLSSRSDEDRGEREVAAWVLNALHAVRVSRVFERERQWREVCFASATMSRARVVLGKTGEDLACEELKRRGYAIVARRYRQRAGELDIIARDGPTLVFVEVKARDGHAFGGAAEAVTPFKRRRIARLALDYLVRHHLHDAPCRFDVVSVHVDGGRPTIEVFQNAFDA